LGGGEKKHGTSRRRFRLGLAGEIESRAGQRLYTNLGGKEHKVLAAACMTKVGLGAEERIEKKRSVAPRHWQGRGRPGIDTTGLGYESA